MLIKVADLWRSPNPRKNTASIVLLRQALGAAVGKLPLPGLKKNICGLSD
jgi:hypothetical protein